jgi:ATP/maltotriose-dependent transcriptional regulator MalT
MPTPDRELLIAVAPAAERQAEARRPASDGGSSDLRLIDRVDLFAALDRAAARKVTIISAPAGSGKTSLLPPTNLSRQEIARELSVSLNTVNTHVRNIYTKLQARDRSSAVRRARELQLLATGRTR